MGFVKRMDHNVANRIGLYRGTRLFEWQMLFFRVRGYYIVLTRIKAMSLPLLAFGKDVVNAIFLEHSEEIKLSPSHIGIQNIPSDVFYDDKKHCQMKSERRRIQNLFKHLRWSVFAQTVNVLKLLTGHTKTLHLRCLKGF